MDSFKLVTWNVNSVRIRLAPLKLLCQLANPDIVCIQEVKAKEEDFPFAEIRGLGFEHIALYGQAGYNGVAILSKHPLKEIEQCNWVGKKDARHIRATVFDDIEINDIYIPAGGDVPDPIENLAFAHKLCFMDDMAEYFEQHKSELQNRKMLLCGDFNVAPSENDVWSHKQLLKIVSHTPVEVERLTRLFQSLDFVDVVRQFYPEPQKIYSWWSYRNPNWQVNDKGRRLDHIWVTPNLRHRLLNATVIKELRLCGRPSDHVPVLAEIKL
ncbi:MAG: endonuclease/exonuclease/phosphatase family protein [Alphaproteobacteria bacterium]|nr:endonuclease/exonuclease/phosphatase family protein [Alphaproteobacteria bacterium]